MDDTHTKHGHGHSPEENPAVSYERSDLDIFAVTKFGIGLAIGTVAAVFLMWGLFQWFMHHQSQALEELPPSVIEARKGLLPPEPRLQSMGIPESPSVARGALRSPSVELMQLREDEARQSEMYAWVDPAKGIARIPIEVAKDLVLKQGRLPVKVSTEGQVVIKTPNPGEGVGTPSAAQPQRVYETGGAAIGSAQVIHLPEEEKSENEKAVGAKSEPSEKK
jgi:hypothetical protein